MAAKLGKKILTGIFLLLFILGTVYLVFNENGVIKFFKLRQQVNSLKEEVNKIKEDNKRIQNDIDSLQEKVPAKIEKVAREKYNMIRKGEKAVKIIEK